MKRYKRGYNLIDVVVYVQLKAEAGEKIKMASQKQIEILLKNGYSKEQVDKMSYDEISSIIGGLFTKPAQNKFQKTIPHPDVEKIQNASEYAQKNAYKPKGEYHLTPEQVRTNALVAAQIWYPHLLDSPTEIELFWKCVDTFEQYISARGA